MSLERIDPTLLTSANAVLTAIHDKDCWQLGLLRAEELEELARKNDCFRGERRCIRRLWELGFLQADIVESDTPVEVEGLEYLGPIRGRHVYADRRALKLREEGYADSFQEAVDPALAHLDPLFHPFRCFVLTKLSRALRLDITTTQVLRCSDGLARIGAREAKEFKQWTSQQEAMACIQHWNEIASLASVAEPPVHLAMFSRLTSRRFDATAESIARDLQEIQSLTTPIFEGIGRTAVERLRSEIMQQAHSLDSNRELHLIIRLMPAQERERIKGKIGGATLLFHMAESLRRNYEQATGETLPEEDEMGFAKVAPGFKKQMQGSTRILDGDRLPANQFLRRVGLDYGVRVRVYVEGKTELGAFRAEFEHHASVEIIDLKGQFVQKAAKGLSFAESLENDRRSKVFSIVVLDGDVPENVRVVENAQKQGKVCGKVWVCKPDFEYESFSSEELAQIALSVIESENGDPIALSDVLPSVKDAKDMPSFKRAFDRRLPDGYVLSKDEDWGAAMMEHAMSNPVRNELEGTPKRSLCAMVELIYQCARIPYEPENQRLELRGHTEQGR